MEKKKGKKMDRVAANAEVGVTKDARNGTQDLALRRSTGNAVGTLRGSFSRRGNASAEESEGKN